MYKHTGSTHERTIPALWPEKFNMGRTDLSLDPISDPACLEVVYTKVGCWSVSIKTADLAPVMEEHWQQRGIRRSNMLHPFWIDIDAKTINSRLVPMKILWDARNHLNNN